MAYRIFISASDDDQSRRYVQAVKEALFRFNEFPVTAVTLNDLGAAGSNPQQTWESARQLIAEADIFIGLYTGEYGRIPAGQTQSCAELEYHYAHERGLPCLIFLPEPLRSGGTERFAAFRDHLAATHVIGYFSSAADLQAKVILAVSNFKQVRRQQAALQPGVRYFSGGAPAPEIAADIDTLPPAPGAPIARATPAAAPALPPAPPQWDSAAWQEVVDQAIAVAGDDLEQIVRRALELHDAHKTVQSPAPADGLRITPIFGAPMQQSQFQADIFMITPFRQHFDEIYQNVIRPVVTALNLTIKRGDDFASTTGIIINEVWAAIYACRVVIVETTEVNANVYYELGIAHTLGKPAILLTQEKDPLKWPFDIRHLRFIVYENTIPGGEKLEADLRKALVWILNDLAASQPASPVDPAAP